MREERERSPFSIVGPGNLVPWWIWYLWCGESKAAVFASMGGAENIMSNERRNNS